VDELTDSLWKATALQESGTLKSLNVRPTAEDPILYPSRPHDLPVRKYKESSMALGSTQPIAIANKLVDVVTVDGEQPTGDKGEKKPQFTSISYFPDGKQMIGGSTYNSARRWDLQTGEEIKNAQVICEREVWAVAVSSDSRWVIVGGRDRDRNDVGELKACEVETGMMQTFEGHSRIVSCIDVSVDNRLLASGSFDHTARYGT